MENTKAKRETQTFTKLHNNPGKFQLLTQTQCTARVQFKYALLVNISHKNNVNAVGLVSILNLVYPIPIGIWHARIKCSLYYVYMNYCALCQDTVQ